MALAMVQDCFWSVTLTVTGKRWEPQALERSGNIVGVDAREKQHLAKISKQSVTIRTGGLDIGLDIVGGRECNLGTPRTDFPATKVTEERVSLVAVDVDEARKFGCLSSSSSSGQEQQPTFSNFSPTTSTTNAIKSPQFITLNSPRSQE